MISLRRPTSSHVEEYREALESAAPTCPPAPVPPPGFHRDVFHQTADARPDAFARGRRAIQHWAAHRGSGVEVFPADAEVAVGETVAIVTRQLGLWVLAACRVTSVIDEESRFGFVYATLPDHPEDGYESFIVADHGDEVVFTIEAVSRPATPLVELALPLTRALQRRAAKAYLQALVDWKDPV